LTETLVVETEQTQLVLENTGAVLQVDITDTQLLAVTEQGPVGPAGPAGSVNDYTHTQSSPSPTWTINHNLGRKPDVTLLSVGGQEFEGTITHVSTNQAVVSLTTATAGTARCI
jgi:hypothetical protein